MKKKKTLKPASRQNIDNFFLIRKPRFNRVNVIIIKKCSDPYRVLIYLAECWPIVVFLFGMCSVYFPNAYDYIKELTQEII